MRSNNSTRLRDAAFPGIKMERKKHVDNQRYLNKYLLEQQPYFQNEHYFPDQKLDASLLNSLDSRDRQTPIEYGSIMLNRQAVNRSANPKQGNYLSSANLGMHNQLMNKSLLDDRLLGSN